MKMVEAEGLTKYYGDKPGAIDVSFTVEKGEIVGLLGPNGAGKTTVMKMMSGQLMPSAGRIFVKGLDMVREGRQASQYVGYLPEHPPLYPDMTVEEYLTFVARIRGLGKKEQESKLEDLMEIVSIGDVRHRIIKNLSKGYRQRVGIAQALLGDSQLLILDEPTVGLDPKQIAEVRKLMLNLKATHTIILSSHILSEISMICEKLIVLNHGRIVAQGPREHIDGRRDSDDHVKLVLRSNAQDVLTLLKGVEGLSSIVERKDLTGQGKCAFHLVSADEESKVRLFYALSKAGIPILELASITPSLEQIFLNLTEGGES